jgi:ankyrin repeat protein
MRQDGSGWTPLMIAASLKNSEGDSIIELLLRKEADVNVKSVTGQVITCIPIDHLTLLPTSHPIHHIPS